MTRRLFVALTAAAPAAEPRLPPDADHARQRLDSSPRHGEWVTVTEGRPDAGRWHDAVRAWVSYPERATRAPAVIVIHEIFGLTDWVRGVADEIAAEGFLAIAPDLLTGHGPGGATPSDPREAEKLVSGLRIEDVARRLTSMARYVASLPYASGRFAALGFGWGGGQGFAFAGNEPKLAAAVVYYGPSPDQKTIGRIQSPVLGLYAGEDDPVNATIPDAETELGRPGRGFEKHLFAGAGHGFLRQQSGQQGANREAVRKAWPLTIAFLRRNLEGKS